MSIRVRLSPQSSRCSVTAYFIDPESESIRIKYSLGTTKTTKSEGLYRTCFDVTSETEFELLLKDARGIEDLRDQLCEMPLNFVSSFTRDQNGDVEVVLLKQYSTAEDNTAALLFPDWHTVMTPIWDTDITDMRSALTALQAYIFKARRLFDELLTECYNLSLLQASEIRRLNASSPPLGSPITIRATRVAIFETQLVYIEAVANFVGTVTMAVNDGIPGCPDGFRCGLSNADLEYLRESKQVRLEQKLQLYPTLLGRLFGQDTRIDSENHHWGLFKALKKIRDRMTHVRIDPSDTVIDLSLDSVRPAVSITDDDLYSAARVIYWLNEFLSSMFDSIGVHGGALDRHFNDSIGFRLLFMHLGHLAGVPEDRILREYSNWGTSGSIHSAFKTYRR